MFHLVKYSIIWKVKNFNIFFWPFIFPIILGTLFYIAFGNVKEADFETIPAAVVEETEDSRVFLGFLEEQEIHFGRVFSEQPTLNDVFLHITGTQLRD